MKEELKDKHIRKREVNITVSKVHLIPDRNGNIVKIVLSCPTGEEYGFRPKKTVKSVEDFEGIEIVGNSYESYNKFEIKELFGKTILYPLRDAILKSKGQAKVIINCTRLERFDDEISDWLVSYYMNEDEFLNIWIEGTDKEDSPKLAWMKEQSNKKDLNFMEE